MKRLLAVFALLSIVLALIPMGIFPTGASAQTTSGVSVPILRPSISSVSSSTVEPGDWVVIQGQNFLVPGVIVSQLQIWLAHDNGGVYWWGINSNTGKPVSPDFWDQDSIQFQIPEDAPEQSGTLYVVVGNVFAQHDQRFAILPASESVPIPYYGEPYEKKQTFYGSPGFTLDASCTVPYTDSLAFGFYASAFMSQGYPGLLATMSEGTYTDVGQTITVAYEAGPSVRFGFRKFVTSGIGSYQNPSISLVGDGRSYTIRVYAANFPYGGQPTQGPLAGELQFGIDCTQ